MEEQDIDIINRETKKDQIIKFIKDSKRKIIYIILIIVFIPIIIFSYQAYKVKGKKQLAEKFNLITINFDNENTSETIKNLEQIINKKDKTYSPLALYFLIDNNLIKNQSKVNDYFDLIIDDIDLDEEIKDLIIYKKAIFNSGDSNGDNLVKILNPIINKDSIWKSHALYLLGEFYYSKDDKLKAKEYFEEIVNLNNANEEIRLQSQIRLQRDLSD
tara:strand:- start:75 stop:722 length:648 start_codon:yes stop_codon:yes gene_type:complete